jgi:hypothetical protein
MWTDAHRRAAQAAALGAILALAAGGLADLSWRALPHPRPLEELSYYPSGQFLKPMTLGHAESAADLAWLRAVQYYGEHRATDSRFERMSHVFDILTSLSPSFVPAYVFGGFALAQEGGQVESGERLMLRGMEANPSSGEMAFQLGFFYFVRPGGRDLRNAGAYFEQAARQPDAPDQASRFAAYAHQNAGELPVAYMLWDDVLKHSSNRYLQDIARREMEKIRTAIETGRKDLAVKRMTVPRVILAPGS